MKSISAIDDSPYFDLTTKDLAEISIYETNSKDSCFVATQGKTHIYKGFKLSNNPKINICCDIGFFPSSITGKYIPRPTFFKIDKAHQEILTNKQKLIVEFNKTDTATNFWKMIGFLNKFKDLVDIGDFEESYSVRNKNAYMLEFSDKETGDKIKDLQELFSKVDFSEHEIEAVLKADRKKNLQHYKRLLDDAEAWKIYYDKYKHEIKGHGEESVWHHFLKKHHWLLGLNADLRFIRDFIVEADVGVKNTSSSGSPVADFLGISDFTTLVELKTPNTPIFSESKRSTSRANTWSFSSDFIDGVSQCLSQKTGWDKKHKDKDMTQNGETLDQDRYRTLDTKVIFIIGNKKFQLPETSREIDTLDKRDTFERFRRNNRNLDIITYDELYERAYYIVHNEKVL